VDLSDVADGALVVWPRTYRWVPMPPQARGALLGTHPLQRRRRPTREEEREAGLGSDGRRG